MAKKNRIGLRIPDQSPATGKVIYLNDREISEWVERLPLANIGETSRQIFQNLRQHNKTILPYKKRFIGTEHLRNPVKYVGSNLEKHFVNIGFPLSEKAHKIAVLNRELHSGLATAYKCVVVDIVLSNNGRTDHKILTTAIHRAIHHLSKVMLLAALVYDSYPKRIWHELHVLHRLACRYNLESVEVGDQLEPRNSTSSIDLCYRRMVLFCLSSPYKIRQKENIQIFDALLEWAKHTRFYTNDEAPTEATIVLKQDSDVPPAHSTLGSDADSKYTLKLDASKLISKLRNHFDEDGPENKLWDIDFLDKNLLRQLIQLWSSEQKRTFVRTKLNFELRVAVGLSKIYRLVLDGKNQQAEELPEQGENQAAWVEQKFAEGNLFDISARFTLEPMDNNNRTEARRGGFEEFGPNTNDMGSEHTAPPIWDISKSQEEAESTYLFNTLNESAGGYCLDWKGKQPPRILVGELIGIQSAMTNSQFGVGLVRWMKNHPEESLQVGLQMIAPNAIAVTAKHQDIANSNPHECLLLPEVGTSGQPTSFICPSYPFNVGDLLTIDDGETTREIKLTRLLESSGAVSQFQFTHLDNHTYPQEEDQDEDDLDADSDFDNLWSTL
ncbi:MAG: hypothetical protein QNJ78_14950 [Gammaproteobacteria bacterium]|nr:hypothetical protein [Gammaproteobacteria bacterium]